MERSDIRCIVIKHLVDSVDDLDPAQIDTSRSMKELGANSLDIVEVVSRTMRELKIKVPRSELAKLANIDGLVDLLYDVARAQAKAA